MPSPQRRTALARGELDRYKVEIVALSETRLEEEEHLKEVGAGYTFVWSGRMKEEQRKAGVGFSIKSHLVSKLQKGTNDRLLTLRLPLSGKRQQCEVYLQTDNSKRQAFISDFCSRLDALEHSSEAPFTLQQEIP